MSWLEDRLVGISERAIGAQIRADKRKAMLRKRNSPEPMPPRPAGTRADGSPLIDISRAPSSMEDAAKRWSAAE